MKNLTLTSLLALCLLPFAQAQLPTNNLAPAGVNLITDTNGNLLNLMSFFSANSNLLNASVAPTGGGSQTPLTVNVNGAQKSLTNLASLQANLATNGSLIVSNVLTGSNATFFTITSTNGFIGAATSATNLIGNLSAAQLTGSHTAPDAILSTNVPLLNTSNTFGGINTFTNNSGTGSVSVGEGAHGYNFTWDTHSKSEGQVQLTDFQGDFLFFGDNANDISPNTFMFAIFDATDNFFPIRWEPDGYLILDGTGSGGNGGILSLYESSGPAYLTGVAITNSHNTSLNTLTAMSATVTNTTSLLGSNTLAGLNATANATFTTSTNTGNDGIGGNLIVSGIVSGNGQSLTNLTGLSFTNTPSLTATTNTTVTFGGILYSSFITPAGNVCFNNFTGNQGACSYGFIGTNGVLWPTNLHTLGNTNGLTLKGTNWYYQGTNAMAISFWALTNLASNPQLTNILCCFSGN